MLTTIRRLWCRLMHSPYHLTRPVRGRFRCMVCLSEFTADWAEPQRPEPAIETQEEPARG